MQITAAPPEQRFLFYDMDWSFYDSLLERLGDRPVFVTYDRGNLEVMSPSRKHEAYAKLIGRLIETLTEELEIPLRSGRSTTFRRKDLDRGLEPDECYWLRNESRVRGKLELDLAHDSPPDLAVEVEISARLLDREGIYAALGVPELWRFDGERLRVSTLGPDGRYRPSAGSAALPGVPIPELERFLAMWNTTDETTLVRAFREWVRHNVSKT